MKKNFFLFIIVGIFFTTVNAQVDIGGGLNFATEIDNIGFSIDGVYKINSTWEAAADFILYLEKDNVNWKSLDFNAHYLFSNSNNLDIYALGGLNFLMWSIDTGINSFDRDDTEININLGAGLRKAITSKVAIFGEGKFVIGDGDHINLKVGVLFNLN